MMFYDFQTTTYGKWILAGEHSVIRGGGALVFPIKEKQLQLIYRSDSVLKVTASGRTGGDFLVLFDYVIKKALQQLDRPQSILTGHFHWDANLPVGQGMGASAALCVAISRWFIAQRWLDKKACFNFSKALEHFFHGKSSGLDIAGVSAETGVYFEKGCCTPIHLKWHPQWVLSSCNQSGITSQCVKTVQTLHEQKPLLALQLDEQMQQSVMLAKMALESDTIDKQKNLVLAINSANDCFQQWGLVNAALKKHMQYLIALGAIAVKPTGSGGGGYVISLWDKQPPVDLVCIKG